MGRPLWTDQNFLTHITALLWHHACGGVQHLGGNLSTAGREAVEARGAHVVAGGLVDGAVESLGEEHTHAVGAAQSHDINNLPKQHMILCQCAGVLTF